MAVNTDVRSAFRASVRPGRLAWPALLAGLALLGLGLAWADSTVFHALFPTFPVPGRLARAPGQVPAGADLVPRVRVGPKWLIAMGSRGIFQFGWFVSAALAVVLLSSLALVAFPRRARVAVERMEAAGGLPTALAAGVASSLLVAAATLLLRNSFFFLGMVPVLWAIAGVCLAFGLASLALYLGRWLSRRLGEVHPLLAALAGSLLICDAALVPYAGWALLGMVVLAGLGLGAVTRFGSTSGWSLDELKW